MSDAADAVTNAYAATMSAHAEMINANAVVINALNEERKKNNGACKAYAVTIDLHEKKEVRLKAKLQVCSLFGALFKFNV